MTFTPANLSTYQGRDQGIQLGIEQCIKKGIEQCMEYGIEQCIDQIEVTRK